MSANIDTMFSVREKPWHGLGVVLEVAPNTSEEIIEAAKLDWTVADTPMHADFNDGSGMKPVRNYHTIYREDTKNILGVVNRSVVQTVQNKDMFKSVDPLINNYIETETAASLGLGETVFGCFKIKEPYRIVDDEFEHYFVVMNEHGKSDGKVTVLNTPVRVVCQNTLSAALSSNYLKMRIPVAADQMAASLLSHKLKESADGAKQQLEHKAEKMLKQKVTKDQVEALLDELFPYIITPDTSTFDSSHEKANEKTTVLRETFVNECLLADNLANYRGTAYQIYNGVTDYYQHYWTSTESAYDLDKRMQTLPGYGISENVSKVTKTLKFLNKLAA